MHIYYLSFYLLFPPVAYFLALCRTDLPKVHVLNVMVCFFCLSFLCVSDVGVGVVN
ncbi:hypothetical protein BC829DRAFT_378773, partial [Chytridium lagenaria]